MVTKAALKKSTQNRQEWLANLLTAKPEDMKLFSNRLGLPESVRTWIEKANYWFFDPTEDIDARFGIVLEEGEIYWFLLNQNNVQGEDFAALNALLKNKVPYRNPKLEIGNEEIQSGVLAVQDLEAETPTQETLDLPEDYHHQNLEIQGQPRVDTERLFTVFGSRASLAEAVHYSNENLNRHNVDEPSIPTRSRLLGSMINLVDDVFDGLDARLTRLATPAFIAHAVSLFDMRLSYHVSAESEEFEESDLTKLYLTLSDRYADATEQGMVPLHILDEFIKHRQEALIEFFKSLRMYTAGYNESHYNRRRDRDDRSRRDVDSGHRPIPRVMESQRRRHHPRDENPFDRGRETETRASRYEQDDRR